MITYCHHYSILFCRVNCHYGTLLGKKHNTLQHHFCCSFLETPTAASLVGLKTILQIRMSASFVLCHLIVLNRTTSALIIPGAILFWNYSSDQNLCWKNHKDWQMLPVPIIRSVIAFSPRDRPIIFPLEHSSYERLL